MYLGFDYQIIWQFSLWFSCHFPHFCQVSHLFGQAVNFAADRQDFEPASLSKDGWHPEWPMMKEPMIVPLVRDSEVLLVARSSVNCNRSPSFIKFLLSKPQARRPKRLHKNNQASIFVEYSWSFFHPQHFWCVNHVSTRLVVAYSSNLLLPWVVEPLFEKNLPYQINAEIMSLCLWGGCGSTTFWAWWECDWCGAKRVVNVTFSFPASILQHVTKISHLPSSRAKSVTSK